jgi:hypothetical protein
VAQWDISDKNPYVVVDWKEEDARRPVPVTGRRGLFIPWKFKVAFVVTNRYVLLTLQATEHLRELHEIAGTEPPAMHGDAIVKQLEVRTDEYWPADAAEFARIPLKRWTKIAVAAAAGTRDEIKRAQPPEGATERELRQKKVPFPELAPRPVGRPRMEAGFTYRDRFIDLDEVISVAKAGGAKPVKAVQEHFGDSGDPVPRRTAQRWVKRARAEKGISA